MAIIILGAIIAGIRDLSFDAYGYGLVFTANICTATYLALIARIGNMHASHLTMFMKFSFYCLLLNYSFMFLGKSSSLNTFGLMWCNGKTINLQNYYGLIINLFLFNLIGLDSSLIERFATCRSNLHSFFVILDIRER